MTANSEHLAYCQKAASKFQSLMSHMTEKKDKKCNRNEEAKAGGSGSDAKK